MVITQSIGARLPSRAPKLVYVRYHGIELRTRGGDTEEEIDRFTSTPESSAQPSSSAPARGPYRLDRLLDRVDQMYTMLDSHVQHTATQFGYIQGQIIALSS